LFALAANLMEPETVRFTALHMGSPTRTNQTTNREEHIMSDKSKN